MTVYKEMMKDSGATPVASLFLFQQLLNDCVKLVYSISALDAS